MKQVFPTFDNPRGCFRLLDCLSGESSKDKVARGGTGGGDNLGFFVGLCAGDVSGVSSNLFDILSAPVNRTGSKSIFFLSSSQDIIDILTRVSTRFFVLVRLI